MGQPKAWLDLDGEPMLVTVCRTVAAAVTVAMVVGSAGAALPELPAGVARVDDPAERRHGGPLAGVLTGLEAIADAGPSVVFVGSCDAAWLTTAHVNWILDALEAAADCAAIVPVTVAADGARIICATSGAVRLAAALDAARSLVTSPNCALRRLYEVLDARYVPVAQLPDPEVVRSCNTVAQWQAARAARARG